MQLLQTCCFMVSTAISELVSLLEPLECFLLRHQRRARLETVALSSLFPSGCVVRAD